MINSTKRFRPIFNLHNNTFDHIQDDGKFSFSTEHEGPNNTLQINALVGEGDNVVHFKDVFAATIGVNNLDEIVEPEQKEGLRCDIEGKYTDVAAKIINSFAITSHDTSDFAVYWAPYGKLVRLVIIIHLVKLS